MSFPKFELKSLFVAFAVLVVVSSAQADWGRGGRCMEATQQLSTAQATLQQATLILGQINNICGGNIACIITAQNHYNTAVQGVQTATTQKDYACGCQEAIERLNSAQNAFTQAQLVLLNINNICGGALACIITGQNAYNQAQAALSNAQTEKARVCHGGGWHGRGGRGHGGGHGVGVDE
jgi:hypothetical protein